MDALLARAGLDGQERPLVWAALVVVICGLALWQARRLTVQGRSAHAAVLVGCATIVASPVSWTHHEIWTVLASMLLVVSVTAWQRAAGVFLLVAMTLNLGNVAFELLPTPGLQYLFDNARGLGVVLLCCVGFGSAVRARRDAGQVSRLRALWRVVGPVLVGLLVFAVLPLPASSDPHLHMFTLAETREEFSQTTVTCDAGPCDMSLDGRLLLNYSTGSDGRRQVVDGWASSKIARLAMRTAPGAPSHTVPLMDLGDGQHVFSFSGENLYDGQFLAYDANGRLLENPPRNLWK